jgi:DNA invertase Pin-like site-specific DNA recombinase
VSDPKVTAAHLRRTAVYCRQSTLIQVERNRESTLRQYDLVSRAGALGWPRSAIRVIDADLGVSGSGLAARAGFTELTEQIALGQVGVVLALEVSRLARSSAEWYRLLDLCGITDTLIADEASVYHPGMFDDRLLLGLKGTMAEAELQVLRARMLGGLRNKAARGELRIPLPAGLVRGDAPGQILLHPDEAVRGAITAVFDRFAASGSARQTWLWLRENGLKLPSVRDGQLAWSTAAYPAVHKILTHPGYAGAYVYGRTRAERCIGESGSPAAKRRVVNHIMVAVKGSAFAQPLQGCAGCLHIGIDWLAVAGGDKCPHGRCPFLRDCREVLWRGCSGPTPDAVRYLVVNMRAGSPRAFAVLDRLTPS